MSMELEGFVPAPQFAEEPAIHYEPFDEPRLHDLDVTIEQMQVQLGQRSITSAMLLMQKCVLAFNAVANGLDVPFNALAGRFQAIRSLIRLAAGGGGGNCNGYTIEIGTSGLSIAFHFDAPNPTIFTTAMSAVVGPKKLFSEDPDS